MLQKIHGCNGWHGVKQWGWITGASGNVYLRRGIETLFDTGVGTGTSQFLSRAAVVCGEGF